MRGLFTIVLCALYLMFGSAADLVHVHGAAGHASESTGLHVDHAHIGEHDHHASERHDETPDHEEELGAERQVEHHAGDALYLAVTATRSLDPGPRVTPAIVVARTSIGRSSRIITRLDARACQPRDPPREILPPLRAPPA